MEELKPYCLHCGKLMRSYPHQGYWWFKCSCGAESPHVWHGTEIEAIAAWNRRTAPENKPLTLEQLRTMDENEPVYLKGKGNAYASLCYLGAGTINHEQDCFAAYYFGLDEADFLDCDDYGKTWLAYARKPEQEENHD